MCFTYLWFLFWYDYCQFHVFIMNVIICYYFYVCYYFVNTIVNIYVIINVMLCFHFYLWLLFWFVIDNLRYLLWMSWNVIISICVIIFVMSLLIFMVLLFMLCIVAFSLCYYFVRVIRYCLCYYCYPCLCFLSMLLSLLMFALFILI